MYLQIKSPDVLMNCHVVAELQMSDDLKEVQTTEDSNMDAWDGFSTVTLHLE